MAFDRYRMFENTTVGAYRRALFSALGGADPNDLLSDEVAETDVHDRETRLERAHSHDVVNAFFEERGIDPKHDPVSALRAIESKSLASWMLAGSGKSIPPQFDRTGKINPAYAAFETWACGMNEVLAKPVMAGMVDSGLMQGAIDRAGRGVSGINFRNFMHGGLTLDSHFETLMGVMSMAEGSGDSLRMGFYQLEHAGVMAGIQNALDRGVRTNVYLGGPKNLVGDAMLRQLTQWQGGPVGYALGVSVGAPNVEEHFKVVGANLTLGPDGRLASPLERRALWIGSANATYGALGRGQANRPGGYLRTGSNMEASFLLSYGMVDAGYFGDDTAVGRKIFDSLTTQAARALDWVESGSRVRQNFALGLNHTVKSRLLETHGLRDQQVAIINDLIDRAGRGEKVRAHVANFGFEVGYLRHIERLVRAGGEVTLLYSPREESGTAPALAQLQAKLGSYSGPGRLNLIRHHDGFMHMKTAIYEYGEANDRRFHRS